jgi:triphosphoribosyl-dephospho-CoA synthase
MNDVVLNAELACVWEATARKAGNVHRGRDFTGLKYLDLLHSAVAIAPVLARAPEATLGRTVLDAIRATRAVVTTNSNLGIVLLLTPLAKVAEYQDYQQAVADLLRDLTLDDSCKVYEAIALAGPGGMGESPEQDLRCTPTLPLREIMRLAEERDRIAWQYVHDFDDVFRRGVPLLCEGLRRFGCLEEAIQFAHLTLLRDVPDTLIARKLGAEAAMEASRRAAAVLQAGWPTSGPGRLAFDNFDCWLCEPGRNPGTTADLIAACLFVALREGIITLPLAVPFSRGWPL